MRVNDFTYREDGLFTVLYANTEQSSAELSRFMGLNDGSNKVLTMHFAACKKALRTAGWTIGRAGKVSAKRKAYELAKMYKELDELGFTPI